MTLPENWKKGLIGIISGIAYFVEFDPSLFSKYPWLISLSKFIMIGGLIGLGVVPSRPKNGTNGTTVQKGPPK